VDKPLVFTHVVGNLELPTAVRTVKLDPVDMLPEVVTIQVGSATAVLKLFSP
jgi:hypothetical protein